jgi:hypothetical protein
MIAEIEKYIEIQNNIDQILKDSPLKFLTSLKKQELKNLPFSKK